MRLLAVTLLTAPAFAEDLDVAKLTPFSRKGTQGEFLAALDLVEKKPLAAARALDQLRPRYALLADYCLYHAGRAYYAARNFDLAAARASRVSHGSTLDAEARLLHADALSAAGRDGEAAAAWREYLERYPEGMRRAEVSFRLGDFRRAYVLGTRGPWEGRARPKVDPKTLAPEDRVARGRVIAAAQRHEDAFAEFSAAIDAKPAPAPAVECEARFERAETAWRMRDRTRAAPLYAEAAAVCEKAGDADRRVRALYQQGRCLVNIGKPEDAAAVYALAQTAAGGHSYGDDARLREAEAWTEAGRPERAAALLATLPDLFPQGDMRLEAVWRLARMAWFDKRYDEALAHLDRGLAMGRETDNFAEGRGHYWRGRVLGKLGRAGDARRAYESAIREYPLSYYALWAFQRLRAEGASAARALEFEMIAPIPPKPAALRFADRPLFSTEGFRRSVELWRLGLRRDARREWAAVGVAPGGKDEDLLWLVAALLDAGGFYPESHNLARRTIGGWRVSWPHGANAARWRIAYPRGYGDLLGREAKRAGVPAALFFAIVREESGFDPDSLSYAHAYGLTQMIMPTAKRFADKPKRVTPERLLTPEFNAPIGARFLAFEWNRYGKAAPLAVAAYNAGEGAVDRWVKQRGTLDLDEFVETIPYDQTRRYTKRVLSSYFTYAALYDARAEERVPALPIRVSSAK